MFLFALFALRFAQDNLDVEKVSAPSKNTAKWLTICFSRLKNIKSLTSKNSGTLIVKIKLVMLWSVSVEAGSG
jgi:hypothetical protein